MGLCLISIGFMEIVEMATEMLMTFYLLNILSLSTDVLSMIPLILILMIILPLFIWVGA